MSRVALRLRGLLAVAVVAVAVAGPTAVPAHADGSRAVVIVDTGSGTYARVIAFSGTISGYQALELAGANPETYGFAGQGAAICRLFGVGNDPSGSSCLGTADDPRYWAYFRAPAGSGGWTYSRAGAGSTAVSDGDVEGWRFGTGGAPGFRAFCDVAGCAPAAPAPPAPVDAAPTGGTAGGSAGGSSPPGVATPAANGQIPTTEADGVAPAPDAVPPSTSLPADSGSAAGRARGAGSRALEAPPVVADDGGSGSPVGVLIALVLVAAIAAASVWVRRRARRAG